MDISTYEETDILSQTLSSPYFNLLPIRSPGGGNYDKALGGCELAVTDKARCIICNSKIPAETPRVWVLGKYGQPPPDEGIIDIKRFICYSCSITFLNSRKHRIDQFIKKAISAQEELKTLIPIEEKFNKLMNEDNVQKRIKADLMLKELTRENDR